MGESVEGQITRVAAFLAGEGLRPESWVHQSIEGLVSCYGELWRPQRRPHPFTAKQAYRQCFANAARLALAVPELTYVEGYARGSSGFVVHHAWCVDLAGGVIDRTWRQRDVEVGEYFGIPIDTDWLRSWLMVTGWFGVFSGAPEWSWQILAHGPADAMFPSSRARDKVSREVTQKSLAFG